MQIFLPEKRRTVCKTETLHGKLYSRKYLLLKSFTNSRPTLLQRNEKQIVVQHTIKKGCKKTIVMDEEEGAAPGFQ